MNNTSQNPLLTNNDYSNENWQPLVGSPNVIQWQNELNFNNNNEVKILDESSLSSFFSTEDEFNVNKQLTDEILQNELAEFLVLNNVPQENNINQNNIDNAQQQCTNENAESSVHLTITTTAQSVTKLYFLKVKEKEWVYPSQRIKKDQSQPEIRYETKSTFTGVFYIYIDLFEVSPNNNAQPRLSVHKLQRTEDQASKPIFAKMEHMGGGVYYFAMPSFKLIRTKDHNPTQRSVWRAKYKAFHDVVGFSELTPMKTQEQVDNLISMHLLERKGNYEYVCLGAYICVQYMNDDGAPYNRIVDGPFFSGKLSSL